MSTLKDVAALAQCSLTTASIVANGRGDEMHISRHPAARCRSYPAASVPPGPRGAAAAGRPAPSHHRAVLAAGSPHHSTGR